MLRMVYLMHFASDLLNFGWWKDDPHRSFLHVAIDPHLIHVLNVGWWKDDPHHSFIQVAIDPHLIHVV